MKDPWNHNQHLAGPSYREGRLGSVSLAVKFFQHPQGHVRHCQVARLQLGRYVRTMAQLPSRSSIHLVSGLPVIH